MTRAKNSPAQKIESPAPAPIAPKADSRTLALHVITKVDRGESLTARERDVLLNAPHAPCPSHIAEPIGYFGDNLRGAAQHTLAVADAHKKTVDDVRGFAAGKFKPEDLGRFVDRVARLRGAAY